MKRAVVGVTGASGSIYADAMVRALLAQGWFTHIVCTEHGSRVMAHETGFNAAQWVEALKIRHMSVTLEDDNDLFSPIASGSFRVDAVIVIPCSMATLGQISNGTGKNLLCRAADTALKEGRRLLIVPRETPLSAIHLENMLKLARLGAGILPAMPGFYAHPQSVNDIADFVAGKALDWLGVEHALYIRWGETP